MLPRALAATLVILLVAAAQASGAAPLRVLIPDTSYFATDSERYAIWGDPQTDTPVILDTRTGRRSMPLLPRRCALLGMEPTDQLRPGRAWFWCNDPDGEHGVFVDLRTGATAPASAGGPTWPSGHPGACRLARHDRGADPFTLPEAWARPYLFDIAWGKAGHLELRRCGHAPRTVVAHGRVQSPRIGGGFVSWQTGLDVDGEGYYSGRTRPVDRVWTYRIRDGARRSWRIPRVPFDVDAGQVDRAGLSWHTRDAVFWAAVAEVNCDKLCDPSGWRVFSAPLR
jgi:hypothetical protein